MLKRNKDTAVVYFTDEAVQLAFVSRRAQVQCIDFLWTDDILDLPDQDIIERIREVLNEHKAIRRKTICVLSAGSAITKNIEIPSTDQTEIKSIIDLQAGRHTPFSREEIIAGYINFGVYQKNYSKVLLAIANRKTVCRQIHILQNAGLVVEHVFFTPEMKAGFYANLFELPTDDAPIGLIDVSRKSTDFTIVKGKNPIACRSLPVGFEHLDQDKDAAQKKFFDELTQSIASYQKEDIEVIPKEYILFDSNPCARALHAFLTAQIDQPLKMVAYAERIVFSPDAQEVMINYPKDSFLDVVAPSFCNHTIHIDFLPDEIRMQRAIEDQGREGIKLGVLVIVLLILVSTFLMIRVYFKNALLERIQSEYALTEQEARALEQISTKTRIVKAYLNSRLVPLNTLRELYRIIPDEIYLRTFVLEESGKIMIEGTSDSMSQVFALVGTLENSDLFKGVQTQSTTARKERGRDVASFEITFFLEGAKETDNGDAGESKDIAL